MKEFWVLGIHVTDRVNNVSEVQSILAKFGCIIKTRLGLHEAGDGSDSSGGLIILELTGKRDEFVSLENELLKIQGLEVKNMVFTE